MGTTVCAGLIAIGLWALSGRAVAAPPRAEAHEVLRGQCLLYAAGVDNPWALAHGITGLGRAYAAADGRRAADVIIGDFLKRDGPVDGDPFRFDRFAADGTPIEPHLNLIPKTLVLAELPLSTELKASFGTVTLKQLVDGVKRGVRHQSASEVYWRDAAWTLDLLAAVLRPGPSAVFQNGAGETVDFNKVMDDALEYLERTQADLADGLAKGLPQVDKRKQGIYAHPCGGLHLVQAVGSWARHPAVRKRWGDRLKKQVDILFYRLGSEQRQYEAALQQAPGYRLLILTQMVKFYGHFLETAGRLKVESGFKPDEEQLRSVERAKIYLDRAVRGLKEIKALESMEQLRKTQHQVYLDLIGDSCHATHGWDYWR